MFVQHYLGPDQSVSYLVGFPEFGRGLLVDPRREHAEQVRLDMQAHGLRRPLVLWTASRAAPRQGGASMVHLWAAPQDASEGQMVGLGSQRFVLVPGGVGLDVQVHGERTGSGRCGFLQLSGLPEKLRVLPLPEVDGLAFVVGDALFTGRPLLADRRGAGTPQRLLELPGSTRIHAGRALLGEHVATVEQERERASGRRALELR